LKRIGAQQILYIAGLGCTRVVSAKRGMQQGILTKKAPIQPRHMTIGGHSPYPRHMVDGCHAERMPADSSSEAFSFDDNHASRTDFARSETTLGQASNYPPQTPIGQAVSFDFDLNNVSLNTSKVPTLHGCASHEAIKPINDEPRIEKSDLTAPPPLPETPAKAKLNARELLFIVTVCMAQFLTLGGLGQSVAPLFIIGKDLGVAPTDLGTMSWYTAAFSLTVGAFILPAGMSCTHSTLATTC